MSKIEEVTQFVASVFDLYRLNAYEFFCDTDIDTFDLVDIPLFATEEIDDATLTRISIATGLSKKEILNCDENAKMRYWNKYPFFELFYEFVDTKNWSMNHTSPEEELIASIFYERPSIPINGKRYDLAKIKKRLYAYLKEIDKVVPGTYHQNAQINNLQISTKGFFSFPECETMIRSFIEIMKVVETLFFKALREPLSEKEANELNFLATFFRVSDLVMPGTNITYDNIRLYRTAYLEENYKDFNSYVKIRDFIQLDPWSCKEFFDDIELIQSFIDFFPDAKPKMKDFVMSVSNFWCSFTWSDVEITPLSTDFDYSNVGTADDVYEEQHPYLYLPKQKEELQGCENSIEQMRRAISPPSQGGLRIPNRSCKVDHFTMFERMKRRIDLKCTGKMQPSLPFSSYLQEV